MTANNIQQIIDRLDTIDEDRSRMRSEMAETRGAFRLGKFIVGLLGLTGISSLAAWLAAQGK